MLGKPPILRRKKVWEKFILATASRDPDFAGIFVTLRRSRWIGRCTAAWRLFWRTNLDAFLGYVKRVPGPLEFEPIDPKKKDPNLRSTAPCPG